MFTIEPPPPSSMIGTAARVRAWAVSTLKLNARLMNPVEVSSSGRGVVPPTLLTTMSSRPNTSLRHRRQRGDRVEVAQVRRHDVGAAAQCLDLWRDGSELLFGACRQHDVGARLGKGERRGGPDPPSSTRHDCDLPVHPEALRRHGRAPYLTARQILVTTAGESGSGCATRAQLTESRTQ